MPKDGKRILILETSGKHDNGKTDDKRCKVIRDAFRTYMQRKTGTPAFVVESMGPSRDLVLLATASTLIGSVSTFSLVAAMCNRRGNIILPRAALFHSKMATERVFDSVNTVSKRFAFVSFSHGISACSGKHGLGDMTADQIAKRLASKGDPARFAWKGGFGERCHPA